VRLLGVIGWPIAHSRSPAMQNAALQHNSLPFVYLPFAVRPEDLRAAIDGARALGVRGLNVTIPHKEAALALCRPDDLAQKVGAVNTLIFDDLPSEAGLSMVRGANTDVHGFRMLMEEAGIVKCDRTVILGAGGAAKAVKAALPHAVMVARRPRPPGSEVQPWEKLAELAADADLIVDATPRGLSDDEVDLPATSAAVLDLVVRRETPLTRLAKSRGLKAAAGAAMLLHQGAAAFELWTGTPAPVEVMRKALDAALD
jgi:shikimate dehydrogenase